MLVAAMAVRVRGKPSRVVGVVAFLCLVVATSARLSSPAPFSTALVESRPASRALLWRAPPAVDEGGDDALARAAAGASKVPKCLRSAIAIMCRHMVAPITQCLRHPEYVRRFVQRKAHTSRAEAAFRKRVSRAGLSAKVLLGGGRRAASGWIPAPYEAFDVTQGNHWIATFGSRHYAHDLWATELFQRLTPMEARFVAAMAFLFLREGGTFVVEVPDGYLQDAGHRQRYRAGASPTIRSMWTKDTLVPILETAGFTVTLRQWYDADGTQHTAEGTGEAPSTGAAPGNHLWLEASKEDGCRGWPVGQTLPKEIANLRKLPKGKGKWPIRPGKKKRK